MNEYERLNYIDALDNELFLGSLMLSEWCARIVQEADLTYIHGAFLGSILTVVAGIETCLRYEVGEQRNLARLIEMSSLDEKLKVEIHDLRRYRNHWTHINDPWDDDKLLEHPERIELELELKAKLAVRVLRETIYSHQGT